MSYSLFTHNEMVYSERFNNLSVPEIKRVIDGTEREINEQCVRDINSHVRKIVADYKYTHVDLNDMVTVLNVGRSSIVVEVESCGIDRAERAAALLVERFKLANCPLNKVKGLVLHIQFTAENFKPTWNEFITIEEALEALFRNGSKDNSILIGLTEDGTGKEEDVLTVTAIAIIQD